MRGLQRYDFLGILSVIGALVYALTVVVIVSAGAGVVGLAAASIAVTVGIQMPALAFCQQGDPDVENPMSERPDEDVSDTREFWLWTARHGYCGLCPDQ